MEVRAIAKSVRISPRKLRLVADSMRNMQIEDANRMLEVTHKRAAKIFQKALRSAVANAVNNAKLETNNLLIARVMVNDAPAFKRFRPSTRGRIHPYKKRGSHLTIVLKEKVVKVSAPVKKAEEKKEKKEVTK
jgi:large subunit ribosomal protein L22